MRLVRWKAQRKERPWPFLLLFFPSAASAASLAAPPVSVVLFDDRATIERRGALDLPAGDSVISIVGVPGTLQPDSLTARGQSDGARVSIGSVQTRQVYDAAGVNARRASLEARLLEIDDEIATVAARQAGFVAQEALIGHLAEPPAGPAAVPGLTADPTQWKSAWTILREGAREASEGRHKAEAEIKALQEQRTHLAAEAAAAGKPTPQHEIAVAVHADAAAHFTLSVAYQVGNARWHPVYEARLDSTASQLALVQSAVVSQSTGEDWQNVALTLSTARPSGGTAPPALPPWRITLASPAPPQSAAVPMPMAAPAPAPEMRSRAAAPAQRPADVETADLHANGLSLEYAVAGSSTVRADGSARTVRIAQATLPASLGVRAVPRLDTKAYLSARFALDASAAPILPGQVALYVDGLFVGHAALPLLHPGEKTSLPFGVDDRVKLTYVPQQNRRGQDGMLWNKRNIASVEALITAQNLHTTPMEISVLDQLPISGDAALKVEMTADPAPTTRDVEDRPGLVEWRNVYQPNEQRRIRFGFTATGPDGRDIEGLTPP